MPSRTFCKEVTQKFKNYSGIANDSIGRLVATIVKARRKELEEYKESGETLHDVSSFQQAVDKWIFIIGVQKEIDDERKAVQGANDKDITAMEEWRHE